VQLAVRVDREDQRPVADEARPQRSAGGAVLPPHAALRRLAPGDELVAPPGLAAGGIERDDPERSADHDEPAAVAADLDESAVLDRDMAAALDTGPPQLVAEPEDYTEIAELLGGGLLNGVKIDQSTWLIRARIDTKPLFDMLRSEISPSDGLIAFEASSRKWEAQGITDEVQNGLRRIQLG
jgi:hypothetical protein